jgi:hypothetical protein
MMADSTGVMAFSPFLLLTWLVSLFSGWGDTPERARKRGLKRTARAVAANGYGKFFRTKSVEATPEMAQFFYNVCKVIVPAQGLLQNVPRSTQLKLCVAVSFMDTAQLALLERLSADSIEKRAEETEPDLLFRQAQSEFAALEQGFDEGRLNAVNECYSLILILCQFVLYDHCFLLKKFDLSLTGHSLSRKPVFNAIRGEAVVEELKDFLELTAGLDPNRDWNVPLQALARFSGMEIVNREAWNAMLLMIQDVVQSGIFELVIRFVEKDPDWTWTPCATRENIAAACLELIRSDIFDRLAFIATARRDALIEQRAGVVFGNTKVCRLVHYTEQAGEVYRTKNFPGFTGARALNYLMAFLTEELPEIRSLCELIIIRGRWASTMLSFPLSEALWLLGGFPARITELDETVSGRGSPGAALKLAITRVGQDKGKARLILRSLDSVNGAARQIVVDAVSNLAVLSEGLKDLEEDCRKNPGMIIRNWSELGHFSKAGLEKRIGALRSRLANMLELLNVLTEEATGGNE